MIGFQSPFGHWGGRRHRKHHRHHHDDLRGAGGEHPADAGSDRDSFEPDDDGEAWPGPAAAAGWHGRRGGRFGHGHGHGYGGGRGDWHDFASEDAHAPHAGPPGFRGAAGRDDDPFAGGPGWSRLDMVRRMRAFGRGFGGPRGPGRPGRPGRPLEQGDLRWLVLDLIAAQPRHGYEIIKAIEEAFNGHYTPSPGVIYPTLTLLEETGLISAESQGAKKLYSLTDDGRAEVAAHSADIEAVRDRLAQARSRFGAAPPPELFRAMDNLRAALQVRLAKGELSAEAVQAITTAIDRAAAEIERS